MNPITMLKRSKGQKIILFTPHRIGEYRVIMDIEDKRLLIIVIETGHRSKIYRKY